MKKVPPKKRFRRHRERTFTLSGPATLLNQVETHLKTIRSLGHVSLVPEEPPYVVRRKDGSWKIAEVDSAHPQNDFEVRTYRYTKNKPVEQALIIVNAYLQQNPALVRVRACEDDAFINPNEGNPAPNEGNPAPNEGNPAPNEGNPAPNEGNPAPNEGNPAPQPLPALVDFSPTALAQQPLFQRIGATSNAVQTSSADGEGVTVVILDCFPYFGPHKPFDPDMLDMKGTYVDTLVLFGIDEETGRSRHNEEEDEELCPYAPLPERVPSQSPVRFDDLLPYHGPMVASIVKTLAPKATVIGIRIINNHGVTYSTDIRRAITWVLNNPTIDGKPLLNDPQKVIFNLSLGLRRTQAETVQSCCTFYTIDQAAQRGAWFTIAAGNDSAGRNENPAEPAAYGHYYHTEATYQRVFCVAGTGLPNRLARYSNEGRFAAPATGILLDPDCAATQPNHPIGNKLVRWHGTSFAAPQVAALVARLLSSQAPPTDIKQYVWETSTQPQKWDEVPEISFEKALNALTPQQATSGAPA
nr:S8 family serine peptidase [Ardenticatena sp.]